MRPEKLNQMIQVLQAPHAKLFPITVIHSHFTESEIILNSVKHLFVTLVLNNTKLWKHRPAQSHFLEAIYRNVKTTFSVDETNNPLCIQPFLLIACTRHIITNENNSFEELTLFGGSLPVVVRDTQVFQHTARFC